MTGFGRIGVWFRRGVAVAAVSSLLAAPGIALAQDSPVLPDSAIAVVDGSDVWTDDGQAAYVDSNQTAWQDPNQTIDPNYIADPSLDNGYVDPSTNAIADPNFEDEWVDPNAVAEPALQPETNIPVIDPSAAPPPSYDAPPGAPGTEFAPPAAVYVADTGQSVSGVFLDIWRAWGAALSWGNPITPELLEDGRTVQYYSFGRLEYVPDDPAGNTVQFGEIGSESRPFMLRRGLPGKSAAVATLSREARAWVPVVAPATDDSVAVRFVPETGHTVSGQILDFWTQTGEDSYLGFPVSETYERDGVMFQTFQRGVVAQEGENWPYLMPIGDLMATRWGLDLQPAPQGDLPTYSEELWNPPPVSLEVGAVPVDPNGVRRVLVSLSKQYLWAYQGDAVVWQGYVSTGLTPFDTPPGNFSLLSKIPVQTMEGVLGGEYYNVPNVPDVMYFTNQGHALHGTYWHNNFGNPMSHGCINLPLDVAKWMYQWSSLGMAVDIVP